MLFLYLQIDFLINYNVNESLYFDIADAIIRAEQVYIDKITILELKQKLQQVAMILRKRKLQEDSVELRRQSGDIKRFNDI